MKAPSILSLIIILCCFTGHNILCANDINEYFLNYRLTGKTDFQTEKNILESNNIKKLVKELSPYYSDSIEKIRIKAYYLTYKKGIQEQTSDSKIAVACLMKGCFDKNGGIVGQNLEYLQEFPPSAFNSGAKAQIKALLSKRHIIHHKKIAMLAGYVGAASDIIQQQLLQPDLSNEKRWALSLALARQGNEEYINYCVNAIKKMPVSNDLIYYVIPDLIYIRQKEAIDYCIEIINNNEKLCVSADPDKQEKIVCGYYILELIAPVISDFPFQTDGTGSLITNDYELALTKIRTWFKENPDYILKKEIF